MRAGDVSLGMIVRLARSGDIARIAKTTGHDFIFIDGQHALFSVETIGHIAQTALGDRRRAAGAGAKLRRSRRRPLILDNGATGIIFPDVSTDADARRAVERLQVPAGRQALGVGAAIRISISARCR